MKYITLLLTLLACCSVFALGDGIEFDKEGKIEIPIWVSKNGCIYPKAFEGAVQGTLTIHVNNNGKPLITNEGKPLVLVNNEGKPFISNEGQPLFTLSNTTPLITNNGPLIADNQGKPYFLVTNDGKPIVSFDNQGHPLVELHFDTGSLQKTADNAIYIVVTILGVVMLVICGVLVWYIIRKEREISDHKVYAQKMESECRMLKQKMIADDAVKT